MLGLLISALVGVVLIVIAWHLLRAFLLVAIVAVLVVAGITAFDRLGLTHGHTPAAQFAGLRHTVTHDVQRIEHRITQR